MGKRIWTCSHLWDYWSVSGLPWAADAALTAQIARAEEMILSEDYQRLFKAWPAQAFLVRSRP